MEKNFEEEDFQFTPPEFDMTSAEENVDADNSFTAPSVENTLGDTSSFEFEVIPEEEAETEVKVDENNSEQNFDDFDEIMPKPEDFTKFEFIPEENNADTKSEESFDPPPFEFEVIPEEEAETEVKADENNSEQNFDDFDEIMPKPEDLMQFEAIPEENNTQQEDVQDKVANAIREKMAEMQEDKQETPSFDMTENTEELPSSEPVKEEENEISPSVESLQTEPATKDEMFVKGSENLKDLIKNESLKNVNLKGNEAEL